MAESGIELPPEGETQEERHERFWRNLIGPERRKKIDAIKARGTVRYDPSIKR